MERIKDFLHDYSDVFLAILIIGAMCMVVFLNLNTIFEDPATAVVLNPVDHPESSETEPDIIVIDVDIPEETAAEPGPEDSRHESEPAPPAPEAPAPPAAPQPAASSAPPAAGELVTVTIPNGTPGIGIARILVEKQLLPETGAFVEAAESLDLSLKLKSGTFQIPAGSTPEQMVRIIAGQ